MIGALAGVAVVLAGVVRGARAGAVEGSRAGAVGGSLADETGTGWIVKRVAAVPGDPIPRDTVPALRTAPGTRVPAGHLVVLGDNADRSYDSRRSGYLTTDRLLGVVLRKVGQPLH
ncbi:S26 family signal peptidase [Nonomuraea aurantiaca]|uniref:S26 family signal peptidase n=1 Tax=Nonomuraea aurantiaca TaxID=2878562 RepID=UPI001CD98967|nr:S26 family signal peptidase [Nonomuraea aurantiaca]MCA2225237.1 S26 family signal peptidase [Nonomuraea aurantiaca]